MARTRAATAACPRRRASWAAAARARADLVWGLARKGTEELGVAGREMGRDGPEEVSSSSSSASAEKERGALRAGLRFFLVMGWSLSLGG